MLAKSLYEQNQFMKLLMDKNEIHENSLSAAKWTRLVMYNTLCAYSAADISNIPHCGQGFRFNGTEFTLVHGTRVRTM